MTITKTGIMIKTWNGAMCERRKGVRRMTVKERMLKLMDLLLEESEKIIKKDAPTPQEIAVLPALAEAIVRITAYAVIEKQPKESQSQRSG